MTESRSVSAAVDVPIDPATAFIAFTEELDLWWVRGPINYFDAARAVAMVCEPGVGGRLIEVYDTATGEGLELGRITVWEPGARLSWTSSVDDVEIGVRFTPVSSGTRVRVEATIPAGGTDQGGAAWVRVVDKWFGEWCARRDTALSQQPDLGRLAIGLYYAKPAAAAHWLAAAFGFESPDPLPQGPDPLPDTGHGQPWIEFRVGNCSLFIFKLDGDLPHGTPATHEPWVYVDNLDEHLARAAASGAAILTPIRQTGFRAYTARDLEGHRWTFAQARPTMR
jgi:uncharacterized glyoxalase superfamily protein PhnB